VDECEPLGVGIGFYVNSLNDILQWIVAALYGGYTAPNVLKFHWWRFNAWGYFFGEPPGAHVS
jgi:SSS family solute:Na+ symporter